MPSPLAHGAVALALWPIVRKGGHPMSLWRRGTLGGMLLVGVLGADLDIAVGMIAGDSAFALHGGASHSLFAGVVFASVFCLVCRPLTSLRWGALWLVGVTAWWSHVLLDACTRGRGVAMFWPFTDERFNLPVPLFYGVRHSEPLVWQHHIVTVATELPFVVLMLLLGMWIRKRMSASPELDFRVAATEAQSP